MPRRLSAADLAKLAERFGEQLQNGEAICAKHASSEAHFALFLPDAVVFA